jgi:hypothetical protein
VDRRSEDRLIPKARGFWFSKGKDLSAGRKRAVPAQRIGRTLRVCDHQKSMHDEAHHAEKSADEEPRRLRPQKANTATASTKVLQTSTLVSIGTSIRCLQPAAHAD